MEDPEILWLQAGKKVFDRQATGIAYPDSVYLSLVDKGYIEGAQSNAHITARGFMLLSDIGKPKVEKKKKAKWNGRTYEKPHQSASGND